MGTTDPTIKVTVTWEPERKGWLVQGTYNGIGVHWERIDHSGAPSIDDARAITQSVVAEVRRWLW